MMNTEDYADLYGIRMCGTCAYTRTEYDNLTGYVTQTYSVEWEDTSGTRWRKTCTVVNLGRPDRVPPVDPDEQLAAEHWSEDYAGHPLQAAWEGIKKGRIQRDAELIERMKDHLRRHGLLAAEQLAKQLKVDHTRARALLRTTPSEFQFVGGYKAVWGLAGVDYDKPKRVGHTKAALRDALLQHGPLTAPEAAKAVGKHRDRCMHILSTERDWFHVVGMRPAARHIPATRIFGLVGVHDAT